MSRYEQPYQQQSLVGNLIDQIVYDALNKKMQTKGGREDSDNKKKKKSAVNWSLGETFIMVTLAMPFICTAQFYVFLLLVQHVAEAMRPH